MIHVVPTDATGVTVTATRAMTHLCPHVDEVDNGTITLTWTTTDVTLELHSLAAHLDTYADVRVSHEELNQQIALVVAAAGVGPVWVRSTWDTAGFAVEVTNVVLREPVHTYGA